MSKIAIMRGVTPVFAVLYPPEQRKEIPIPEGRSIIGRGLSASIRLDDPMVSREHCEVTRAGSEIKIRDLGSLNGSFMNGVEIKEAELSLTAKIQLGSTILQLRDADAALSVAERQASLNLDTFNENLRNLAAFSQRNKLPFAIVELTVAHSEPNLPAEVSLRILKILEAAKRRADLVCEVKPFSYKLLMPNVSNETAAQKADELKAAIEAHRFCFNEKIVEVRTEALLSFFPGAEIN